MGIEERKEREKRMRRKAILDAAKKVFATKGFAGATIENIAEQAEFSPATIYIYFKNKDELHASLSLQMLNILAQKVEDVCQRKDLGIEEKIKALPLAFYEVYERDPLNLMHVLRYQSSEALKGLSPEVESEIRNKARQYISAISNLFEEGIRQGLFYKHHPVAVADIVWAVFAGLVLWEDTKKGFDPQKDFLKSTLELSVDLISRGLKKE
ncbi:MAG: TetR/AcrR family transcriptional regulator [Deltaproteobacteria bacterium]|nr:TetR/AcrR family transcriptional regulator [Deltaproteobacteria bacterium]